MAMSTLKDGVGCANVVRGGCRSPACGGPRLRRHPGSTHARGGRARGGEVPEGQGRAGDRTGRVPRRRARGPRRGNATRREDARADRPGPARRASGHRARRPRRRGRGAARERRRPGAAQPTAPQRRGRHDAARIRDGRRSDAGRPGDRDLRAARRRRRAPALRGAADPRRGPEPHAPLPGEDLLPVLPGPRPRVRQQGLPRRQAVDRGSRDVRDRRRVPAAARGRPHHRRGGLPAHAAGPQRGHHPGCREPAAAAPRRRSRGAPGDPLGRGAVAAGHGGRDRRAGRDGRGDRGPGGGADLLGRRLRIRQSGGVPGRAGAAGSVPRVHGRVRARAGALLLLARADRQPRAQLARAREGRVILDAIESASRDELETLQGARLRETLARRGPDGELRELPFTVKDDLREAYPIGLIAVPHEQLVRIHASSGTGGVATVVAYTRNDLEVWTQVMARALYGAGVRAGMVVHNAYGYGLFTGGLGFHQGAERLGATVVPVSGGLTARQAVLLRDLRAQVLCCTPSYALHIAESGAEGLCLEVGLFGAEPWSEEMRAELESRLGLAALNVYGLSEIVGPGVSAECREGRSGSHVQEDHFVVEVIDPESLAPVAPGELGELVFTTLTKEALPLVRYRTGDIASLDMSPCVCGRTTARMGPVRGRRDDMLIIRGVNLYPSQVEHALLTVDGVSPHWQLVVTRPAQLDEFTVRCEPAEGFADRGELAARVRRALHDQIGVGIGVELLDPGAVPRSEGKAVRVVDRR